MGAADRMKAMRERRRAAGVRQVRLLLPDMRTASVRERMAEQVARLTPAQEQDALAWIEAVSEFDAPDVPA